MGLKLLYNGQVTDFSDSKYDPKNYGSMRLNIRAGGEIRKYGLATSAEQVSDKRLRFKINNNTYYIGTSEARSRQSNHTSYSTYYTYTYTSPEQRSSVLTRQGTTTTTSKFSQGPGRTTYHFTFHTGSRIIYTHRFTYTHKEIRRILTRTESIRTTAYWSGNVSYTVAPERLTKVSVTRQATKNNQYFKTGNTNYTKTTLTRGAGSPGSVTILSRTSLVEKVTKYTTIVSGTGTSSTPTMYTHTSITSKTVTANINWTTSHYRSYSYKVDNPVVTSVESGTTAIAPNYLLEREVSSVSNTATYVNYSQYVPVNTISVSGGVVPGSHYTVKSTSVVYASISSFLEWLGYGTSSTSKTPIVGLPSNYTVSSISPYAALPGETYYYTDSDCTATYVSNYSTSYYTVTRTLTSNQPTKTSVGSTLTTRVSHYTDHNFV